MGLREESEIDSIDSGDCLVPDNTADEIREGGKMIKVQKIQREDGPKYKNKEATYFLHRPAGSLRKELYCYQEDPQTKELLKTNLSPFLLKHRHKVLDTTGGVRRRLTASEVLANAPHRRLVVLERLLEDIKRANRNRDH